MGFSIKFLRSIDLPQVWTLGEKAGHIRALNVQRAII